MVLKSFKKFLESVRQEDVLFDNHFYKRTKQRPINEGLVRKFLSLPEKIDKIERGKGKYRFKVWYKMSRKYWLVLIIEFISGKKFKVISAWNSDRKWQSRLRQ